MRLISFISRITDLLKCKCTHPRVLVNPMLPYQVQHFVNHSPHSSQNFPHFDLILILNLYYPNHLSMLLVKSHKCNEHLGTDGI